MTHPTLSGNYPRDEKLIRATWNYDKDLADETELRTAQRTAAKAVVAQQADAGCSDVVDGLFAWQDLLRPVAEATDGIDVGGLVRFHETNTFLRRPLLEEPFAPDDFDADAFLRYTFTDVWKGVDRAKGILPSPYFFLRTAEGSAFDDEAAAGEAVARVLNRAARAFADAGADVVQFNDPTLLHEKEPDVDLARRLLGIATKDLDVETTYYPYAGDAAPHWDRLVQFPCHRLGVDFLATDLEAIDELPSSKNLLAGVVDSRSSVVEPEEVVASFLGRLGEKFDGRRLQATHVYDLEFVPADVAAAKLEALGAACRVKEVAP